MAKRKSKKQKRQAERKHQLRLETAARHAGISASPGTFAAPNTAPQESQAAFLFFVRRRPRRSRPPRRAACPRGANPAACPGHNGLGRSLCAPCPPRSLRATMRRLREGPKHCRTAIAELTGTALPGRWPRPPEPRPEWLPRPRDEEPRPELFPRPAPRPAPPESPPTGERCAPPTDDPKPPEFARADRSAACRARALVSCCSASTCRSCKNCLVSSS